MLDSPGGELRAVFEAEPVEHLRDVIRGCPNGDDQFLCDLAIGATAGNEPGDLALTWCEYWQRPPTCACGVSQVDPIIGAQRSTGRALAELAGPGPQMTRFVGKPFGALAQLHGLSLESVGLCFDTRQQTSDSR
jgi:hypothetical protein